MAQPSDDPRAAFIRSSVWHSPLDGSRDILAAHPEIAAADIHTAALLGDEAAVGRFVALDPASATAKGGPLGWDALTHLCFSSYLRLDPARSDGFVRAAKTLLDAGASANTGFWDVDHRPDPEWESVLYGAAGVARHAALTRLLLDHGANPNDEEVVYHAPEGYDNAALAQLVETGALTPDSLDIMLVRKADWHDRAGLTYLLEHGADPNRVNRWNRTALQHAVLRDNALESVEAMLDHGGDPALLAGGASAAAIAARRGRADLLALFDRRGLPLGLSGVERLIAACARHDEAGIRAIVDREPALVGDLLAEGGARLAEFAGNGSAAGAACLLDLGVSVEALYLEGDAYFGIAERSMALHVAAWRAQHETLRVLIAHGAPVDVHDGRGRTPLSLAVRACVDSYWTHRRSPESVRTLLQAGARVSGIPYPSGYAAVDELLRPHLT